MIPDVSVACVRVTTRIQTGCVEKSHLLAIDPAKPSVLSRKTVLHYSVPTMAGRDAHIPCVRNGRDRSVRVTLKVYNALVQEVAVLVDGMQEAGYRSVEWGASGFTSGVYFYRLQAGTYTDMKKMIVVK